MDCTLRYSTLTEMERMIFAIFFVTLAILTVFGNTLSVKFMFSYLSQSTNNSNNKVLASLAISGCLTGYIILPMNAIQMLSRPALNSCTVDDVRSYLSVIALGNSAFTISMIAYERYLLLNHNMSIKVKTFRILIIAAWALPALLPIMRFLGEYFYIIAVSMAVVVPYAVLLLSYYYIMKSVKKQEDKLLLHYFKRDFMDTASKTKVKKSKVKKHVKVAKTVAMLIIVYFVCITPLHFWFVLEIVQQNYQVAPLETRQMLYGVAMLLTGLNSCLNPYVYFGKTPEFKKEFTKFSKLWSKNEVQQMSKSHLELVNKESTGVKM